MDDNCALAKETHMSHNIVKEQFSIMTNRGLVCDVCFTTKHNWSSRTEYCTIALRITVGDLQYTAICHSKYNENRGGGGGGGSNIGSSSYA